MNKSIENVHLLIKVKMDNGMVKGNLVTLKSTTVYIYI